MPDDSSRVKTERWPVPREPPANVHVVARRPKLRVEAADLYEVARRNAMLQPGMCSASESETRTCTGPPGAFATQAAIASSPAGGRLGPPIAA